MHGRNNGKKLMTVRIIKHSFEIIHLLTGEVMYLELQCFSHHFWRVGFQVHSEVCNELRNFEMSLVGEYQTSCFPLEFRDSLVGRTVECPTWKIQAVFFLSVTNLDACLSHFSLSNIEWVTELKIQGDSRLFIDSRIAQSLSFCRRFMQPDTFNSHQFCDRLLAHWNFDRRIAI